MSAHEHLSHQHLSDDVLIDGLYGLADVEAGVRECAECASRWNELREKRAVMCAPVEAAADVLAAQRANVYRAIEHPLRARWENLSPMQWAAPAMAAACVLAIGLFMHHPSAAPVHPAPNTAGETQTASDVYSDVYSMEQSFEPSATASIRVLFDEDGAATEDQGTHQATQQGNQQ